MYYIIFMRIFEFNINKLANYINANIHFENFYRDINVVIYYL